MLRIEAGEIMKGSSVENWATNYGLVVSFIRLTFTLAAIFLLASCSKNVVKNHYVNERDVDPGRPGHWLTRASADARMYEAYDLPESEREYRPFLGVAISGGGSRAANFGLYVLEELQRLGVLDRIDAISSVSGGSIVAAHFGLYYPRYQDAYWPMAERDLSQDLRDDWLARHIRPSNWQTLYRSDFNASTILAQTYDAMLFHGKTFADLGVPGRGRPHILLNTTAVGAPPGFPSDCVAQGRNAFSDSLSTFVFTDQAFQSCLGSFLGSYSIAQAVAASSAYPVLFSPVALEVYPTFFQNSNKPVQYLHLIDGGIADNLGTDALVHAANERWHDGQEQDSLDGTNRTISDPVPCFLIVVDAFIDGGEKLEDEYPDLRHGLIDRAIDPSWKYAFDGLLQRRRTDTLASLGINVGREDGRSDYDRATSGHVISLGDERGMVEVVHGPIVTLERRKSDLTCAVWHISLRDVYEIGADRSNVLVDPVTKFKRGSIYAMVTNTDTDLKLTGGVSCSVREHQEALSDAAKILVREDTQALSVLHKWLLDHDIPSNSNWTPDRYGSDGRRFNVTGVKKGPLGIPSGIVRCLN
jgi:NTE family protein